MHFLDFVLRNLLRRRVRTALTIVGVSVAIAAVVALLSITDGYVRSTTEQLAGHGVDMVVVRAGVTDRATSTLEEPVAEQLKKLDGVDKVAPALSHNLSFADKGSLTTQPLNGWPPDSFAFDALTIIAGRLFEPSDEKTVLLGKVLAQRLDKKVDDEVEIEGTKFKVIGIFETANMAENGAAVISLRDQQELMQRKGQVSQFQIAMRKDLPDREAAMLALRHEIENLTDEEGQKLGLQAQATEDFVRSDNQTRLARAMAWVTSAIALIVGSIGMLNTMIVSVLERTQEIGILRAIGWRKSRIMRMIMIESFTLSFAGAVFGILLAFLMVRVLVAFPAAQGFVSGDITMQVVLIAYLLSVLVGLVGGAYPALRGASLPPTEALRYE